jgi:hypothetical protein
MLAVIVSEFLLFAAVAFHPQLPWKENGGGETVLQRVFPPLLVGSFSEGWLATLMMLTGGYVLIIGEFVFHDRQ